MSTKPRNYHSQGGPTYDRHGGLFEKYTIEFKHMSSGEVVRFPAILTNYNDSWSSNWNEETFFGRMDPVARFQNTSRKISFQVAVVNDDPTESGENLAKFQLLTRMLYPGYSSVDQETMNPYQYAGVSTMRNAPLIGLKLANLITGTKNEGDFLTGFMDGFTFQPDLQMGFWKVDGMDNRQLVENPKWKSGQPLWIPDTTQNDVVSIENPSLFPKKWEVGGTFTVLHTHPLGWNEDGNWMKGAGDYPFHADKLKNAMPPHLSEKWEVEKRANIKEAKVPKSVKKGLLDKLVDALLKP